MSSTVFQVGGTPLAPPGARAALADTGRLIDAQWRSNQWFKLTRTHDDIADSIGAAVLPRILSSL